MALCRLCLSIPIDNLPDFSTSYFTHMNGWNRINDFQLAHGAPKPRGLLGFPHQPDLQSLRISAAACDLCCLILAQIDLVIDEFRVAQQDNFFQQNHIAGYPTFDLFLTRRRDTGDGFLVLSHGTVRKIVYLLGAVGLSVRDDDPLAPFFPGRIMDDNPGNLKTLSRAASWLRDCEQHPDCAPPISPLPTRVIDVGENQNDSTIRLVECPPGTSERYIALSHCWGQSNKPITTTKENKTQRLKTIHLDETSKSFQEAVTVTRLLGIRYIWIDSLCIIQDDPNDWDREAANMHSVYSNSFLTISITGAKDGSIGCFSQRNPRKYVRLSHTDKNGTQGEVFAFALPVEKEVDANKYITMDAEPLTDRGWCFQERVLSRRILHFASDQMYFECLEGFRNEDGLYLSTRYFTLHGQKTSHHLPAPRHPNPNRHLELWYSLLWSYGPRKLTKGSDKLPALGGVAAMFAEKLTDQYVAGIWRKSMIEGILWQGLDITEVEEDRMPSWSWASINGIAAIGLIGRWEPLACILDYHIEMKGENKFGEVKNGWIKMEAPLLPVVLVDSKKRADDTSMDLPLHPKHLYFRTSRGSTSGSHGRFDFISRKHVEAEDLARKGLVFSLILAVDVGTASSRVMNYHSLLVTPVEGKDVNTMKRIGFLLQDIESLGDDEARSSRTIVTLV